MALGGRWQPLKALSGMGNAAMGGRRQEMKFMQGEGHGEELEDGKESGGGGLKRLESRGEEGGDPRGRLPYLGKLSPPPWRLMPNFCPLLSW